MNSFHPPEKGCFGEALQERSAGDFRLCEYNATLAPDDVPEHAHDEAHFVLVLRGAYVSSARSMPETSDGPVLVFNPPGTIHRDRFATTGGLFLSVSVPAQQWAETPDARRAAMPRRMGISAMTVAWHLRAQLVHSDFASPLQLECASHELLALAAQHAPERNARPQWLDRVRERLDETQMDAPSLAELARDAGVHPVHLSRAFRRHFGCSPGSWLRETRLQRAVTVLAKTRCTIAEAVQEAGFYDQSHLHRSLQAVAGLSPRSLRNLMPALN